MSQRESGYARKERDLYETPCWVTEVLLPQLEGVSAIWEPAAGSGKMVHVLERIPCPIAASDIAPAVNIFASDFLTRTSWPEDACPLGVRPAIITNPPYELATEFCAHALQLMEPVGGIVAMLLRCDFDHAKSRTHLFRDCPAFAKKLVLMKRITWFVEENGKPKASPSFNHAWYLWDWKHEGPPIIGYAP